MGHVLKGLGYKGAMKLWYVASEYKLDRLIKVENDIDALALS